MPLDGSNTVPSVIDFPSAVSAPLVPETNHVARTESGSKDIATEAKCGEKITLTKEIIKKPLLVSVDSCHKTEQPKPGRRFIPGNGSSHPRFHDLPDIIPSGKNIQYKQIKDTMYKKTTGSTESKDLERAHYFLYKYGNINKTFESVNNRYGDADSFNIYKKYSDIASESDPEIDSTEEN